MEQIKQQVQSVKELKEEIKSLRDKLVALDNTSEDYKETVEKLVEDEKKLKEVMSAGKAQIDGVTGSYNAYVKEMSALKKAWRATADEGERARIGERIGQINDELKRMDSSIGNYQRNVGNYEQAFTSALKTPQQELKALRVQLAQLTAGTAEYNAVFTRMAQLTHDVKEQQEMLKWSSADLGDILGNLTGIAQGIAGGFSALNAFTGLIGDGNEDIEKAMLNTQRWMQLIQGLGAIEELGDKLKGLWQGLKNFAQSQNTAVASMGDFSDKAEAVEGTATQVSTALNTQSTIMKQTTASAIELAEGMKLLNNEELKEIETLNQQITMLQQEIVARNQLISELERAIEIEALTQEQGEGQIKINKQIIDSLQKTQDECGERIKQIKSQSDANKVLSNSEKAVGTSTSWLSKQVDLLNGKFITMQASSNMVVRGFGKIGAGAIALGTTIKAALISTGIGALIVLLGTLLASMWKFIDGTAKAEERTKKLNDSVDALNESLEQQEKSWEREEKMLEAQGASYETIYEARRKNLEAQLAEVRANLKVQEGIAREIGQRKLQKAKYDEFRKTLEDLRKTEEDLAEQIVDLDWDKQVEEVKNNTKAIKEAEVERKKAYEQRIKDYQNEQKEAKKLYDTLKDYYRSDIALLTKKYKEEYKLLSKMDADKKTIAKAQALLTQKYNIEVNNITLSATKEIWDRIRANNAKNIEVIGNDNKAYYDEQIKEAERYRDSLILTQENIKNGVAEGEAFAYLNAFEGTDIKNITEFNTEIAVAEKRVRDAQKALLEFQSSNVVTQLGKDLDSLGAEYNAVMNTFALKTEEANSKSLFKGFYAGTTIGEMKVELEARYTLQEQYLDAEIALYEEANKRKDLTDEARAEIVANLAYLQIAKTDLLTQKTIESNNLMIDSYNLMADSVQGIATSLTDILGSVSDMIMENAEAQLEAGEITQEEYNKQFEKSKALQIAQATINTIAGAVGAFMGITRDTGGWGIALAIAQATAVLAAGMAQIQQIKNTHPSSNGGGSSSARYAEVTPSATSDYSPTLTQNATGQQETQDLANAMSNMNLWVSVSEIDKAQNKGKVRVQESSF